jgi:hypothetical protein
MILTGNRKFSVPSALLLESSPSASYDHGPQFLAEIWGQLAKVTVAICTTMHNRICIPPNLRLGLTATHGRRHAQFA